jgi:hypothetical protein
MFDTKIIVGAFIGALVALVVYGLVIKKMVEKSSLEELEEMGMLEE